MIVSAIKEFLDLYGSKKEPTHGVSKHATPTKIGDAKKHVTNLAHDKPLKAAHDPTRSESFTSEVRTQKNPP